MMEEKIYYSFDNYTLDINKIYGMCNTIGWSPHCIVGIPRGGLIPAVHLSHMMRSKFATVGITTRDNAATQINPLDVVGFVDKINQGQKFLFIDDILDSGKTLQILVDQLEKNGVREHYKIATLFYNPSNSVSIRPEFYCRTIDRQTDQRWIDFWWEDDSFKTTY